PFGHAAQLGDGVRIRVEIVRVRQVLLVVDVRIGLPDDHHALRAHALGVVESFLEPPEISRRRRTVAAPAVRPVVVARQPSGCAARQSRALGNVNNPNGVGRARRTGAGYGTSAPLMLCQRIRLSASSSIRSYSRKSIRAEIAAP